MCVSILGPAPGPAPPPLGIGVSILRNAGLASTWPSAAAHRNSEMRETLGVVAGLGWHRWQVRSRLCHSDTLAGQAARHQPSGIQGLTFNQVSPLPCFLGQVHREFRALIGPGWCVTKKPQEDFGGGLLLKLEVGDAHRAPTPTPHCLRPCGAGIISACNWLQLLSSKRGTHYVAELCSSGWPQTPRAPPAPASRVLVLKPV